MCFSGCEGRFVRASLRESRLKKGDRQTINKPKKRIKYIPLHHAYVVLQNLKVVRRWRWIF